MNIAACPTHSLRMRGRTFLALVLTPDPNAPVDNIMIEQIVMYERCALDQTSADLAPPKNDYTTNCS